MSTVQYNVLYYSPPYFFMIVHKNHYDRARVSSVYTQYVVSQEQSDALFSPNSIGMTTQEKTRDQVFMITFGLLSCPVQYVRFDNHNNTATPFVCVSVYKQYLIAHKNRK